MTDETPTTPTGEGDVLREQARSSLRHVLRIAQVALVLAVAVYGLSGIRTIRPNEVGIKLSFGKVVRADLKPGIHMALPWPAGRIERVAVKTVERVVVDDMSADLSTEAASGEFYKRTGLKSYCMTGDNNLVHITFTMQYVVADPVDYLYHSRDHEELLRHLASSAALHAVGVMPVEDVMTSGKGAIAEEVRRRVAHDLDAMDVGLGITSVELTEVVPPPKVQKNFDDVVNAQLEARKVISEAESYRNTKLPQANGQANRLHQQSESYKQQQVKHAQGEAERFVAQLSEYRKARQVSRQRLYLDFLTRVYPKLHNKIIVQEVGGEPVGHIRLQADGNRRGK